MAIRKRFDLTNYRSNDPVKFAVVATLNRLGYYTLAVEDFGADIKTFFPAKGFQEHEVEHRTIWTGEKFPYNSIHIPERKTRLLGQRNLYYWVVNNEVTHAMVCNANQCMIQKNLKMIPNKQISTGEEFYDISITYFKLVKL